MRYQTGIFINYINTYPTEMERMFQAVEYIIKHGAGGNVLDELSKKSFKDTTNDYFNRIKNEAIAHNNGLLIIYKALLKWYETWKDSFSNFNINNASVKYREQPIHTWLHCFLTGQQNIYQSLIGEEYVFIDKSKWEEAKRNNIKANRYPVIQKQEVDYTEVKIKRLLRLYEIDPEIKYKELLLDKRIAVFLEDDWTKDQLEELQKKYHLKNVKQYSAIEPTNNDIGNFDYYLFLTSKASHSAKYKLESKIPKDKLFLISSTNYRLVMDQFLEQLKGRFLL
ncbi:hypothetical protein GLV94_08045 [Virgibacillus halodenitrificans]|uniref:hypothetical protein n=1 Tax=Virgibacillus halodenitrificans TaxID=1482 RepID=UPI00136E6DC4|nr:hypothetical protein [Virgibacillus halodenitrificans]MYL45596.1 hypothetical protein [Virgibacillus halodenitrificans]